MEIEVALKIISNLEKNISKIELDNRSKLKYLRLRNKVEDCFVYKTPDCCKS